MARKGNQRATQVTHTAYGVATVIPDPQRSQGWELLFDGVAQSYVDLGDPRHLAYEYVRRLASVIRGAADAAGAAGPLRVLHLGGGALTLARWVATTRPGATQRVVDRDGPLLDLVTRLLPVPAPVEIVVGDAREVLAAEPAGAYDVIVCDVFDGARMPASVATTGFAAAAARALRPGGTLTVNLTDLPPLAYARVQAATLLAVFAEVALIAGNQMFGGRRAGNVILAATDAAPGLPATTLSADAARDPVPGRVLAGDALREFVSGARARLDEPR